MANRPKVSIIVPVYNTQQYLHQCLDSLVNQTLKDIEIVCVDDGSTDASFEILKEYADKDSRVKYYRSTVSKSALSARKKAVEMSEGQYIMFLDSDDYLGLTACEILRDKIAAENVDILHFSSEIVNCANLPQSRIELNKKLILPYEKKLNGTEVFFDCFVNKKYFFTLWNKIYKADVVKQAFEQLEEKYLPKAQDLLAYFLIAYYAQSYMGWKSDALHYYCFGRGVTGSDDFNLDKFTRYCHQKEIVACLEKFCQDKGINDEKIHSVIHNYHSQWLKECIDLWKNRLTGQDAAEGYKILCDFWGGKEVVSYFVKHFWDDKTGIARHIGKLGNKTKKDIKTIGVYYYHYTIGGVQKVISLLIPMLVEMGYKVVLITDKQPTDKDFTLPDGVQRVFIHDYRQSLAEDYIPRIDHWDRIISEYGIDTVLYNSWTSGILMWDMLYLKSKGVNFVIQAHSVFTYAVTQLNKEFSEFPPVFALADGMVVLSQADRYFWSAYNDNVHYIPNPVEQSLKTDDKVLWDNQSLIWVGRVSEEKQPMMLFNIMEKVVQRRPQAKLYLVGDFSDKKWANIVAKKSLQNNIIFCGTTADVAQYYKKASVNLLTSRYEGFPMVLVESKAFGLPTVMFDMPYLEMAAENTGVISVANGDCTSAANEICKLLADRALWQACSSQATKDFEKLMSYDYKSAWNKVVSGEKSDIVVDDAARKMIYTIVNHYAFGMKGTTSVESAEGKSKITRLFAMLPKAIGRGIKCYRDNGLEYTVKLIIRKIKAKIF